MEGKRGGFSFLYAAFVRERTPINNPLKCHRMVELEGVIAGGVDFTDFSYLSSTVWQNGGDRQHPEP